MAEANDTATKRKRLYRSMDEKRLAGVCGGIADYFDLDPTAVRLAWVVVTVLSGVLPGVIAYIIAAIVMPVERVGEVKEAPKRPAEAARI